MTVNPLVPKAVDAQVSPSKDVTSADLTVEAAHATHAISKVKPNLASELASFGEV